MKTLILFVALALAINLFLFITSRTLENRYYMSRGLLYNKERGEVIRKLYTLDYEKLESPAFKPCCISIRRRWIKQDLPFTA